MSTTRSRQPNRDDVLEALMWALEHDTAAFDEHRHATQVATDELSRARANKRLLDRYHLANEAPRS